MKEDLPHSGSTVPRRPVLRDLGTAAAGCVISAVIGAPGCSDQNADETEPLSVPLDDLAPGQRVVVRYRDKPIELTRKGDGIRARSLVCTHIGCIVRWDPAERQYICPCHQGRFDENGEVVGGPPTKPLTEIATRVSGTQLILGG